jgi:hypothetical protein
MLVVQNASGTRFSSALRGSDGPDAAERVAEAFAAFHKMPVGITKHRDLEDQYEVLAQSVDRLGVKRPELYDRARDVQSAVTRTSKAVPMRVGPVVKNLRLTQIILAEKRVAVTVVNDLVMAPILVDVGNQLARIALIDDDRKSESDAPAIADHFRRSYVSASAITPEEIAPFEALALLRAACTRADSDNADAAEHALALAEASLSDLPSQVRSPG